MDVIGADGRALGAVLKGPDGKEIMFKEGEPVASGAWRLRADVAALGTVLAIMTIMGVGNHMGWEMFPRWLVHGPAGKWLITATHHQKHHEAYRGNYGLYFRFWDHLCGTDGGLSRP